MAVLFIAVFSGSKSLPSSELVPELRLLGGRERGRRTGDGCKKGDKCEKRNREEGRGGGGERRGRRKEKRGIRKRKRIR